MQWFTFLDIMEHNVNILNPNKGLIPSLLNVFTMFELLLFDDIDNLGAIGIKYINCKKETILYLGTSTLEEMITKFVINAIFHHVGLSWIICSKKEMLYEMDESDHPG